MVLLKAITQSILGQNLNPGTFSESREQELSFGTKVCRITCIIDQEISCLEKRPVLLPTIVSVLMVGNAVGVTSNSYRFNIFPEAYLDLSSQTMEVSSSISK